MRSPSLVAVGIAGAVVLGIVIGLCSWWSAPILLGIALTLWFVARAPVSSLVWLPLGLAMMAPWQRMEPFRSNIAIYPVLVATIVALLALWFRAGMRLRANTAVTLGAATSLWAIIGLLAGYGSALFALRWVLTWLIGLGVYVLLNVDDARTTLVRGSWVACVWLGGYAVLEWAMRGNPVFGSLVPVVLETGFLDAMRYRPSAMMGHPLILADLLGLMTVLCVAGWRGKLLPVALAAVGVGAGFAGLVVTGARGAMLVTAAAVVAVMLVSWRPTVRDSMTALGATLVGAAAISALYPMLSARFAGSLESLSYAQRLLSLAVATEVAGNSPLFGVGAGAASTAMRGQGFVNLTSETEYAGLLMGVGIPGMLAVLAMPVTELLRHVRGWSAQPVAVRSLAVASTVYAIGIIGTHNFFDWWIGGAVYWVCVALAGPAPLKEA